MTTFLLPARSRFGGQRLSPIVAKALGRADRLDVEAGERAQLLRHFELSPRGWPVAALTRAFDANDAASSGWLRADPAYVRPDMTGARLLASGGALQLTAEEAEAFVSALRPTFGDAGMPIDAPAPARWYLRLPREAKVSAMASPADALGGDLFDALPEGPEGRRWRALLSEAQVILHQHPLNASRVAAGKLPVNSLWFWGHGVSPDHVTTPHGYVWSSEITLHALAKAAGRTAQELEGGIEHVGLYDLRAMRDLEEVCEEFLEPALSFMQQRIFPSFAIDCEDGATWRFTRGQRWRFWRKRLKAIDA